MTSTERADRFLELARDRGWVATKHCRTFLTFADRERSFSGMIRFKRANAKDPIVLDLTTAGLGRTREVLSMVHL